MKITINIKSLLRLVQTIIVFLLIANIISILLQNKSNDIYLNGIAKLFDFNEESNIPTLFSTLLLVCCAAILYLIFIEVGKTKKNFRKYWLILSLTFSFLAIDEFCGLHENLIPIVNDVYNLPSYFKYGWVLPYGLAVAVGLFFVIPFIKNLPKNISLLFLLSAFFFLGGAIGMELIGGNHHELYGSNNLQYAIYYTFEELLEMVGSAMFLFSLIKYYRFYATTTDSSLKNNTDVHKKFYLKHSNLEFEPTYTK